MARVSPAVLHPTLCPRVPAEAVVDLDAIAGNVRRAAPAGRPGRGDGGRQGRRATGTAWCRAPVAARAGGATWLGVAQLERGARAAGGRGHRPAAVLAARARATASPTPIAADIDLSVSAIWSLDEIVAAARAVGRTARVHLKIDTGLSRNGVSRHDWADAGGRDAAGRGRRRRPVRRRLVAPGLGRRAAAPQRRCTRSSCSRRPSASPSGPAPGPRCATWPTRRPP